VKSSSSPIGDTVRSWKSKLIGITIAVGLTASLTTPAHGLSASSAQSFKTSTSVSAAKSLIRNLYYGYQQAAGNGWSAQKKYILAHNYPGMYAHPEACLGSTTNLPEISSDFTSVSPDPYWKVPKSVYKNLLTGKVLSGSIFAFQGTVSGLTGKQHFAIFKGKTYLFLWVCDTTNPNYVDPMTLANKTYVAKSQPIWAKENKIINDMANHKVHSMAETLEYCKAISRTLARLKEDVNSLLVPTTDLSDLKQIWLRHIDYLTQFNSSLSSYATSTDPSDASLAAYYQDQAQEALEEYKLLLHSLNY